MSDRDVLEMIDRAAMAAPQMHVAPEDIVAGGRGKVRRRRIAGGGALVGAAALTGALWLTLDGAGGVSTAPLPQPAGTVWESDAAVADTLFTGYQTIDADQVGHTYAGVVRRSGDGPLTLELSDGATVVERIPAQSSTGAVGVEGLEVFAGDRVTVAVWVQPEGTVNAIPYLGQADPGGLSGGRTTVVDDRTLGYAVWPADVMTTPPTVEDVYLVGGTGVATLTGEDVESELLDVGRGPEVLAFADPARAVWGVQQGERPDQTYLFAPSGEAALLSVLSVDADSRSLEVAMLPAGAAAVEITNGATVASDVAELAGRDVVAVAVEDAGESALSRISFELDGVRHPADLYAMNLATLDLGDLVLSDGTQPLDTDVLRLRDDTGADQVVLARSVLDEGLVVTESADGSQVVAAQGFDPGSALLSRTRIGLMASDADPDVADGLRWVSPSDLAQVRTPWGSTVTLLALPREEAEAAVGAVGTAELDGTTVTAWERTGFDGITLTTGNQEGAAVPEIDGTALAPLEGVGPFGDVQLFAHPDGTSAVVLVPSVLADGEVLPVLQRGSSAQVEQWQISQTAELGSDAGSYRLLKVPTFSLEGLLAVAIRPEARLADDAVNDWDLLGPEGNGGHVLLDPGVVLRLSSALWLMAPIGDDPAIRPVAGFVDSSLLAGPRVDPAATGADGTEHLYAVLSPGLLPAGEEPTLLAADGVEIVGTELLDVVDGYQVWHGTIRLPEGQGDLAAAVEGLDVDGGGTADLTLPDAG